MNLLGMGVGSLVESVGKVASDLVTTEKERRELDLREKEIDQRTDLAQIEVNKVEAAHQNVFVAGWRPAAGWVCVGGLGYMGIVRPLLGWVAENTLSWTVPPAIETAHLEILLYGLLGLGVYRTAEKIRGKA